MDNSLTWVEIDKKALTHNVRLFKDLIGKDKQLCSVVKSNAYGHGLKECAKVIAEAGTDWFGVNSFWEAEELREAGAANPIYIMGYIPFGKLERAVNGGFHFVVYNKETLERVAEICKKTGKEAYTHIKVETGNNRQGVNGDKLGDILKVYKENSLVKMEGVSTHFANIEDTTDHSYAEHQLDLFKKFVQEIEDAGFQPKYRHCANSAATILFPETYFNFVRVGISTYGLWPSNETLVSAIQAGKKVDLQPALAWKTRIAQVKHVPEGAYIGYGCTYRATHDMKLAILPMGYYEGYSRLLSNNCYVLIHGKRAPVTGRVCMNITMVDITHIPDAQIEDEVVLIGPQGDEYLPADWLAKCSQTINYEVVTRINDRIPRIVV